METKFLVEVISIQRDAFLILVINHFTSLYNFYLELFKYSTF